jgi:PAS domain S-box-containing protein
MNKIKLLDLNLSLKIKFPLLIVLILIMVSLSGLFIIYINTSSSTHTHREHETLTFAAQSQQNIMSNDPLALDSIMNSMKHSINIKSAIIINKKMTIIAATDLAMLGNKPSAKIQSLINKKIDFYKNKHRIFYLQKINFSGLNLGYLVAEYKYLNIIEMFSPKNNESMYRILLFFGAVSLIITFSMALLINKIIRPITKIGKSIKSYSNIDPIDYQALPLKNDHQHQNDEIESLKYHFNELVSSTKFYAEKNKDYQKNLENMVENRTEELNKANKKSQSILKNIETGIVLIESKSKIIIDANYCAYQILSTNKKDLINKTISVSKVPDKFKFAMAKMTSEKNKPIQIHITEEETVDGKEKFFELSNSIIKTSHQNIQTTLIVISNITDKIMLEKVKNDFLYTITHDLKTPLTSIMGFITLILNDTKTPLNPNHQNYLDIAYNSSVNLYELCADLTNLSKLESDTMNLKLENFELDTVFNEIIPLLSPQANEKNLQLNFNNQDIPIKMIGDPFRLKQAFTNLLGNALKFTDDGHIDVIIDHHGPDASIIISDTGSGMDPSDLPYIFDKYHQVTKNKKSTEGTGLGLAIVKKVITLHNGDISVTSKEGHGTTFTITLPLNIKNNS